ncbi:hypothetical protein [Specibacter cremeus]|uniref:hypothetical protein n=1 Tax=Specibacter cremeus TaxID=1629051 RepID=UPI001F0C920F|nr:hypothetical protein [Specibacter cremeus]
MNDAELNDAELNDAGTADAGIVRVYKTDDGGTLVFREAWVDAGAGDEGSGNAVPAYFVVNHGTVGHQSTSRERAVASGEEARGLLDAFTAQCAEDGYAALVPAEQWWVVAQYALKSDRVTDRDKYLDHKAREALTAHLAWRGSGTVERTEFTAAAHGTGKLNLFVLAPDPAIAVANILVCLREAKLDFTKLTVAVAPHADPTAFKQKHPKPSKGPFTLGG